MIVYKRKIGKIIGTVLAVTMTVFPSITAFASSPESYNNQATISVGKTITATEENVFPDITEFQFLLDPVSYTPGPTSSSATVYTDANLPMPGGTTGAQAITVDGFSKTATGTSQQKTATSAAITYTQAGIYTYKLTERIPGTTDALGTVAGSPVAGVTYDSTVYYVNVYVTNVLNDDGTPLLDASGNPVVNVSAITAWEGSNTTTLDQTQEDNNNNAPDPDDTDGKIAITVPDGTDGGIRNIEYPFVNEYSTASLFVTKIVTGDIADPNQEFSFTLDFDTISGTADTDTYAYQIYSMGDDKAIGGTDANADTLVSTGTIADGGTFSLTHNQYVKVIGLPVGETVETTESGMTDYKTTISVQHGNTATPGSLTTVANEVTANKTTGEQTIYTGDGAVNQENFINNKESVTPTGVLMEVLPYGMLVVLAGLGAVMIFRKRRVNEQ